MKNFTKVLVFMVMFGLIAGFAYSQEQEFLSKKQLRTTVKVNGFNSLWYKTNSGWEEVPSSANKLENLTNAWQKKSDVFHRQSNDEKYKVIFQLAPEQVTKATYKRVIDTPRKVEANYGKMFYAVDEKLTRTKIIRKEVPAGDKALIVKVKPFEKVTTTKKVEDKWRYRSNK